jgi:hypothetical protein
VTDRARLDRDLKHTGRAVVAMTAGSGVYYVDQKIMQAQAARRGAACAARAFAATALLRHAVATAC